MAKKSKFVRRLMMIVTIPLAYMIGTLEILCKSIYRGYREFTYLKGWYRQTWDEIKSAWKE